MHNFFIQHRPFSLVFSIGILLATSNAWSQSLSQLFESAKSYDATFQAAKSEFEANLALLDQVNGSVYPTINFTGSLSRSKLSPQPATTTSAARTYGTRSYGINATQPVYRPSLIATLKQADKQPALLDARLEQVEQDLVIRLSQAYFDVLNSQESLQLVRAQKTAVAEQLAAAKRNFEVGTSTITDSNEAQARFDLARAQEITAENDLRVKQLALSNLVGKADVKPLILKANATLPDLKNEPLEKWVSAAEAEHPAVRAAQINYDVAVLDTEIARDGHKPTLDGYLSVNNTANANGNAQNSLDSRSTTSQAGLSLTIPLFAGFITQNKQKQALALEEKARLDLLNTRRTVAQATRTAYLGVLSGLSAINAYEAAEKSSQSALDSTKLGYQVGVRINADVLNAQSQLYQTKRDLAAARYNVLLGVLKLRMANGTLKASDLASTDKLLSGE